MGCKTREKIARECFCEAGFEASRCGNNAAICSAIDLEIVTLDGAKLNDALEGVGEDSEQSIAQQSRATLASVELPPFLALSQQGIILLFVEWSGVPDTTLPVIDSSKNSNVSRFTISLNIGRARRISQ